MDPRVRVECTGTFFPKRIISIRHLWRVFVYQLSISMKKEQANNPLHGVKLKDILEALVEAYGWEGLGEKINIGCFTNNPSIKSSLKFLRRTPWARDKVEALYLDFLSSAMAKIKNYKEH